MNADRARKPAGQSDERRYGSARLWLLALAVALLGIFLYPLRPNLYDPARSDLLEASRDLENFFQDAERVAQDDRERNQALRRTIDWLRKAAAEDPADLDEINRLTDDLLQWEQQAASGSVSGDALQASFQGLAKRVEQLVEKRTRLHAAKSTH